MADENNLYEIPLRVLNSEGCGLPEELAGAVVACYVSAPDFMAAVKRAKLTVESLGYKFDDLAGNSVREIPIEEWSSYIAVAWPEDVDCFPTQEELPDLIGKGVSFLGPLVGFLK